MKKYEIKKVDVLSGAKLYAAFGVLFGLFFGGLTLIFSIVSQPTNLLLILVGGAFAIIFYALIGAGFAALAIWIYNMLANQIGGLTVYLDEEQHIAPVPMKKVPENIKDDPTLV